MALTTDSTVEKVWRRLSPEQMMSPTILADIAEWIPEALKRVSRAAIGTLHQKNLETEISATLSAADSPHNIQTAAIPATVLPESVEIIDDVRHSDLANSLIRKGSLGELRAATILSTSVYGYYAVQGPNIFTRKGAGALAVTANALKFRAVSLLTAIGSVPAAMEDLLIDELVAMANERGLPDQPESQGDGVVAA